MGNLIGKLQDDEYCNIIALNSGSIYAVDETLELIAYDCRYKLEDGEWFVISEFSQQEYGSIVNNLGNTADLNQLEVGQYREIKHFVFIDENLLFFEKITPAKILKKNIMLFSSEPTLDNQPKVIIFNEKPDAVYNRNNDTLSFKNLGVLKDIFIGINALYREATEEETTDFISNSCIALSGNFSIGDIKPANRKRITMVWENYQNWDQNLKNSFIQYATKYCTNIAYENDKFVVSNEQELKQILFAIDERYYTTELQLEKRLANSVQTLDIE